MKKTTVKKVGKIFATIVVYSFFILCLFMLLITIFAKRDETGGANLFGYQLRIVVSSSMEKCDQTDVSGFEIKDIPVKSMVFVKSVPKDEKEKEAFYASLKEGDVLTFRYVYTKQEIITHRIVDIRAKEGGGYLIQLAGDNKNADSDVLTQTIDTSETNSLNYVLGKVTGQSYFLGLVVTAIKSPIGLLLMIVVPCTIIIVFETVHVAGIVRASKKKKKEETQAEEIERLKRQLAELEKNAGTDEKINEGGKK